MVNRAVFRQKLILQMSRFGDYSTVLLAAYLVGIAVGNEIQDIFHCRALRQSPLGQSQPGFHLGLKILELVRQFALLPVVVSVVPILIMHQGADALSLCFKCAHPACPDAAYLHLGSLAITAQPRVPTLTRPRPGSTLALLFLLDCDNHAFRGLSTTARRKGGRLILTKAAEYVLNYSRTAHIMLVTGAIPFAVAEVRGRAFSGPCPPQHGKHAHRR
jgi:hypothetical protein